MLIKMTKEIFCSTIFPKGTNTNLVEKLLVIALPVSPMHATSFCFKNIARGTTDPEIDSVTWIKFSSNMALLALVANLATRWRHLQ